MTLSSLRFQLSRQFAARRWAITNSLATTTFSSLLRQLTGGEPLHIDERLATEVAPMTLAQLCVSSKNLPAYRFVDLFRAVEAHSLSKVHVRGIESQHEEDLNTLLHGKRQRWPTRQLTQSGRTAWPTGPEEETFLSVDRFWIFKHIENGRPEPFIIRLRYKSLSEHAVLEIAAENAASSEQCLRTIIDHSVEHSIYRNRTLELTFEAGTKDEYGDVERAEHLRVLFKAIEPIPDTDIVIDEVVRQMLWRNIVDLHLRRDLLKANGVPVRRGVLLYGPPGTGKTFACRYLCGKLPEITRIIITGTALLQVTQIFNLARMLHPSLVILEDVDLVFASREVNLYSSVLGDLLDRMDGLRPYEDISFVLTTNAIERMESAIKDRPGRISQCILFGPPQPELRKKYLRHYLRQYDITRLNFDDLVRESEGATQAFLKEWGHRAVQIALERLAPPDSALELRNDDFRHAMTEMRRFSEGSTGKIIGFHSSQ